MKPTRNLSGRMDKEASNVVELTSYFQNKLVEGCWNDRISSKGMDCQTSISPIVIHPRAIDELSRSYYEGLTIEIAVCPKRHDSLIKEVVRDEAFVHYGLFVAKSRREHDGNR